MVFTVRYMLGILLVLISCSAIHTASISSRKVRATEETEVPKNESLHVATTTEPPSTTQLNNAPTKTENPTNKEDADNIAEATTNKKEYVDNTAEATTTSTNKKEYVDNTAEATTNKEENVEATTTSTNKKEYVDNSADATANKGENVEATTSIKEEKYVDHTAEATVTVASLVSATISSEEPATTATIEKEINSLDAINEQETHKEEETTAAKTEVKNNHKEKETTTPKVEVKHQARTENGRSLDFDISKYTSPEFHNRNNVYNLPTSPENQKYVSADFDHKATTAREFTRFSELTTPASKYFDPSYHDFEHGVAQDLEDVDHFFTNTPKTTLNDIIEKAKRNDSETNLDFLKYTSVINENKEDKNAVHKKYENEHRLKINFDSIYNHTALTDEEILVTSETPTVLTTTIPQEKVSFITTTKRPLPTKFTLVNKTLDQSSLFSNKIETETIKPVLINHEDNKIEHSKSNSVSESSDETKSSSSSSESSLSKDSSDETKSDDSTYESKSKDSSEPKETNNASSTEHLEEEEKARISNLVKLSSEELTKISANASSEEHTKSTEASGENNINNLKSADSSNISPELNRSPEENAINVSKRGSTKFIESEPNLTTASLTQNHTKIAEEQIQNTSNSQEENNVYAFVATTISPEPTTINLEEHTETLYEITDERFDTTTEEVVYNTKKARELLTTTKPDEVFYEMTTETTPMPTLVTERDLFGTEETSRFVTDAELTSTTEDLDSVSTTVAPEITTGISMETRDSTAFDALVTTETTIDSTTLSGNESNNDVHVLGESTTVSEEEFSTLASTTEPSPVTQKPTELPIINETSISITTSEPEFDEDEDDEYIDFNNRKINSTSGHDEVDPDAPEEIHRKSVKPSTVNTTQQPTTERAETTTVQEERRVVDESITKASEGTTVDSTTEHEDVTETQTEGNVLTDPESNDGTVIAITISTIGAVCLVLLAVLLFVMRRRQRKFNYGQRCTPVSLDSYSMDNVSVYNSVRRKTAIRDSKRSYGNPAFDDATVSQPLNFQALVKYANSVDEIATEFEAIPMVTARMSELPEGCEVKNRYANVIPLPETRVVLSQTEDDPIGDYINANFVTGPKGVRGYYIACQAPMNNTVNDFWRMIWEQQSKVILMLTHLYETGVEKCVDYLPPSEVLDCHRLFGDYQVTLKNREVKDKYIISSLQLKNMVTNSWREVTHFWYLGWPEKGVPSEENSIIAFLIEARSYVKLVQNSTDIKIKDTSNGGMMNQDVSPVVVHCSPGTGRTGTVIACDIAIREFELKRLVDIPRIVYRIRRDRASSVQTKDQYTFIYRVINLYATKLTGGALDSI